MYICAAPHIPGVDLIKFCRKAHTALLDPFELLMQRLPPRGLPLQWPQRCLTTVAAVADVASMVAAATMMAVASVAAMVAVAAKMYLP